MRDDNDIPLLHYACLGGQMKVILYLIEELKGDIGKNSYYHCMVFNNFVSQ